MQDLKFFSPSTINEAISHLKNNPSITMFAGGTDLLVQKEYKKVQLKSILDLKGISEMHYLSIEEENLRIGANVTISEIQENDYINKKYPFLADAASRLGSWQIRNTATIGGNLCNAAPSAELTPPLMVLESKVVIAGPNGERTLPLGEFMVGPGRTALKKQEILKEIIVPNPPKNSISSYGCRKWRRSMDVAIVNLAILLVMNGDIVQEARVCLGAVAPTAIRAKETEKMLEGNRLEEELINTTSQIVADESRPISDIRASAEYRKEMVKVYFKRALTSLKNKEV